MLSPGMVASIKQGWGEQAHREVARALAKQVGDPYVLGFKGQELDGLGRMIAPRFDVKVRLTNDFSLGGPYGALFPKRKTVAAGLMQDIHAALAKDFYQGFGGRVVVKPGGLNVENGEMALEFISNGRPRDGLKLSADDVKTAKGYARSVMSFVHMSVSHFHRKPDAWRSEPWMRDLSIVPHALTKRRTLTDFATEIQMRHEIKSSLQKLMAENEVEGFIQYRPEYPGFGSLPERDLVSVRIDRYYPKPTEE